MKLLFTAIILFGTSLTTILSIKHGYITLMMDKANICAKMHEVDDQTLAELKSGNFTSDDPKVHCGAKCWFEQLGFINADGMITPNELMLKIALEEPNFFEKIMPCVNMTTAQLRCERAFKVLGCLWRQLIQEKS